MSWVRICFLICGMAFLSGCRTPDAAPPTLASLSGRNFRAVLRTKASGNRKLSWKAVKTYIYTDLDNKNGTVLAVYSATVVSLSTASGKPWPPKKAHMQIEHTWPANAPWGVIGRDTLPGCDLHHLYPTRAGLNGKRSNHPFGRPITKVENLRVKKDGYLAKNGGGTATGSRFGLDAKGVKVFEPRSDHRGNAARAVFYVSVRYDMKIPDGMEAVLRRWHEDDRVDSDEQRQNGRIKSIQGNRNPFVDHPDYVSKIKDF